MHGPEAQYPSCAGPVAARPRTWLPPHLVSPSVDKRNRPLTVATAVTVLIVGVVTTMRLAVDTAPGPAPAQLTSIDAGRAIAPVPAAALGAAPKTATGHAAPVPTRAQLTSIGARRPIAPALSAQPPSPRAVAAEPMPAAALPAAPASTTGQGAATPAAPAENKPTEEPATTTDLDNKPPPQESDTDRDTRRRWVEPDQGQRPDDTHDQLSSRGQTGDSTRKQMAGLCERYGMPGQYCEQAASPRPGN
jgi:hypothetical protein